MPNRTLSDRYELIRVVGRGGMAEVWEARDRVLGRRVAVKILHASLAGDPTFIERFRREATAAASLNHRSMVALYDAGVDGDANYLVMEFLDGETLADCLAREGRIDLDQTVGVGVAVASALQAVHDVGLVHRDVKPANIMITPSQGAKLMDLGIVRGPESTSLTETATVIGTTGYLSPEQASGKPAGPRSDLYALGCVLFEAATGERPFRADSPVAVAVQHMTEAPPVPSTLVPGLPAGFDRVVARALAKEPDRRYADARAMAADLSQLVGEDPGATSAYAVAPTALAPAALAPAAAAPTAVSPIPAEASTATAGRPPADTEVAASPPGRPGGTALWWAALAVVLIILALVAVASGWFDTDEAGPPADPQVPDTEPTAETPPDDPESADEDPAPEPDEEADPEPDDTTTVPPEADASDLDSALEEFVDAADAALANGEIDQSARDNLADKAADAADKARDGDDDALDQIESLRGDLEDLGEELHPSSFQEIRRAIDELERQIRNVL